MKRWKQEMLKAKLEKTRKGLLKVKNSIATSVYGSSLVMKLFMPAKTEFYLLVRIHYYQIEIEIQKY